MLKIKMLSRFAGPMGKMENGLEYLLPRPLAQDLIDHGLAVLVLPPPAPPVAVVNIPSQRLAMETALKELRAKNQATIDRPKKRK